MASQNRARKLLRAKRMVELLETQLLEGSGIVSVNLDGASVTFSREQATKELEYWEKQISRYSRAKSRTSTMNISGCYD